LNDDDAIYRKLLELADKWREMAADEDDPAVASARKQCATDLRVLVFKSKLDDED
jgi:hypothetical protein